MAGERPHRGPLEGSNGVNTDDMARVLWLATQADGGCIVCVGRQIEYAVALWPNQDWDTAIQAFEQLYPDLEEEHCGSRQDFPANLDVRAEIEMALREMATQ